MLGWILALLALGAGGFGYWKYTQNDARRSSEHFYPYDRSSSTTDGNNPYAANAARTPAPGYEYNEEPEEEADDEDELSMQGEEEGYYEDDSEYTDEVYEEEEYEE